MKKLLLTALLAVLSLHNIIKTEADLYAISYTGSIEDLANMDNPLENDDLDKFLKNIPGGKLGVLGTRKLYLHRQMSTGNLIDELTFNLAASYISSDNNSATVHKTWHPLKTSTSTETKHDKAVTIKVTYEKALITKSQAENNKLKLITSTNYDTKSTLLMNTGLASKTSLLYIKIRQNAPSNYVDHGGTTYYNTESTMPLGLEGNTGTGIDANDLYIPIYVSAE